MNEQQVKESLFELIEESLKQYNWEYFRSTYHLHENFGPSSIKHLKSTFNSMLVVFNQLYENRNLVIINQTARDLLRALLDLKNMIEPYDEKEIQRSFIKLLESVLDLSQKIILDTFHPLRKNSFFLCFIKILFFSF